MRCQLRTFCFCTAGVTSRHLNVSFCFVVKCFLSCVCFSTRGFRGSAPRNLFCKREECCVHSQAAERDYCLTRTSAGSSVCRVVGSVFALFSGGFSFLLLCFVLLSISIFLEVPAITKSPPERWRYFEKVFSRGLPQPTDLLVFCLELLIVFRGVAWNLIWMTVSHHLFSLCKLLFPRGVAGTQVFPKNKQTLAQVLAFQAQSVSVLLHFNV